MKKPAQTIVSATLVLAMAVSTTPLAPIAALAEKTSNQEQTAAAPAGGEKPRQLCSQAITLGHSEFPCISSVATAFPWHQRES